MSNHASRLDEQGRCGDAVGVNEPDAMPISSRASCREPCASMWRRVGLVFAIAMLIGLPVRLFIASRAVMVSRDTVTFIWYAQAVADDPLAAMRQNAQHPLYPILVLGAHRILEALPLVPAAVRSDPVRSWTAAAVGVTLLGGLAVIVAAYLLTSRLFNPQVGLLAAVLAAVAAELCQLSADGLTDMPHLAIYLTAIWAGLRGFQTSRVRWFLAVGLLAGLGYLLRPEGAEPAVAAVAVLAAPFACRWSWRKRVIGMACVVVASGVVASPYMLATGKLVQKKSVSRFFEGEPSADSRQQPAAVLCEADAAGTAACDHASLAGDVPRALLTIGAKYFRSLRGTYVLAVAIWIVLRKRMPVDQAGARMVQAAIGLHLAILVALIIQFDYWDLFSLRHVMVLAGLSLPFAAAGVAALIESLPERRQGVAALLAGLVLVVPTLPWMFETRAGEEAHYPVAARWMQENTPHRPRVMTERFRMAFYARGDYIPAPLIANVPEYLARARQSRPDWIAFDERRILKESPSFFADLNAALIADESLELAQEVSHKVSGRDRRVLIYRYRASLTPTTNSGETVTKEN